MSRLGAVEKGLYYPTPERALDLIARQVVLSGGRRLLDPCAGEGWAAAYLAERWGLESYGIELHRGRAEASATRLTRAFHGSYHQIDAPTASFDVLFLNPPYEEGRSATDEGIRQEVQFLRETSKWLIPRGLLVFVPPQHILGNYRFQEAIRSQYEDIEAFRFPDPEYAAFSQVVVFARRRRAAGAYWYPSTFSPPAELPVLGHAEYAASDLPSFDGAFHFRVSGTNPYAIAPEEGEGVYQTQRWRSLMGIGGHDLTAFERPLLAPRPGHVAMLLAAGSLNGTELPGRLLVKGSSEKITVETVDEECAIRRERVVSHLSVLDLGRAEIETWRTDADRERTAAWFDRYGTYLAEAVCRDHVPLFGDAQVGAYDFSSVRAPGVLPGKTIPEVLFAQKRAAAAIAAVWRFRKSAILSGEMGTGKTAVSVVAATLCRYRKVVCVLPTHLVKKWVREVDIICSAPGTARTAKKPSAVDAFFADPRARFLILSKERAKLGARWSAALAERTAQIEREVPDVRFGRSYDYNGVPYRKSVKETVRGAPTCPRCGAVQALGGFPAPRRYFEEDKRKCGKCAEPLWQARPLTAKGTLRWPLARYINRKYAHRFALVIDEAHQYASPDSDQSRAVQHLCSSATKILAMTGTLYGGRASSVFHLLYKVDEGFRRIYRYDECAKFVADHGLFETRVKLDEQTSVYGYRRNNSGGRVREIPGVNPAMINLLLPYTVFLKLQDLGCELPPFEEKVVELDHDSEVLGCAQRLASEVKTVIRKNPKLLGQYLMACLGYPDCPEHAEEIVDVDLERGTTSVVSSAPAFPAQEWAKDRKVAEIALAERAGGRRCLIFFSQTHKRSPIPRVRANLEAQGLRVAVLDANVSPEKREEWLQKCDRFDVLLTNGRLVETGLDLLFATTIIQYGVEYSIPTIRQSTRRSWRLGQVHPVKVYYLAYRNTLQAVAMQLIAKKMRAAQLVDGDALGGLAEHDEGGHDFLLELAREAALSVLERAA